MDFVTGSISVVDHFYRDAFTKCEIATDVEDELAVLMVGIKRDDRIFRHRQMACDPVGLGCERRVVDIARREYFARLKKTQKLLCLKNFLLSTVEVGRHCTRTSRLDLAGVDGRTLSDCGSGSRLNTARDHRIRSERGGGSRCRAAIDRRAHPSGDVRPGEHTAVDRCSCATGDKGAGKDLLLLHLWTHQ
jgi:hypothetical protein